MRKTKPKSRPRRDGENLIARKDGVLCTVCWEVSPVHVGSSGTPLPSLLDGYETVKRLHPNKPHNPQVPR